MATVCNFPTGTGTVEECSSECQAALRLGALEVDIVFPWQRFLTAAESEPEPEACDNDGGDNGGDHRTVAEVASFLARLVGQCHAGGAVVKVILETAAMPDDDDHHDDHHTAPRGVYQASRLALEAGADFLKTSTGLHSRGGATQQAVATLLRAIRDHAAAAAAATTATTATRKSSAVVGVKVCSLGRGDESGEGAFIHSCRMILNKLHRYPVASRRKRKPCNTISSSWTPSCTVTR